MAEKEQLVEITLPLWQPSIRIKPNRLHAFIGKRGSGKSVAMRHVLYCIRKHVQNGVCMSGTELCNEYFGSHIPASFIFDSYRPDVVKRLVKRQLKLKKSGDDPLKKPVFMLLEDCMWEASELIRDKFLRFIFNNGRHLGITLLLSSQFVLDLPPKMRGNLDYVYTFKEHVPKNKLRLWDHFYGIVEQFEVFRQMLNQCTNEHHCLVLDTTGQQNSMEDMLAVWKADATLPAFKVGNQAYWQYHLMNYDPDAEESDSDDDIKCTRKSKVRVRTV